MTAKRGLAIAFFPHHIDHLAPICAMMGAPMLVCDGPGQLDAVRHYPGLKAVAIHQATMAAAVEQIVKSIDQYRPEVIYYSHLFDRATLSEIFGRGKDCPRVVHCPHGFSEKRQTYAQGVALQDVALLYGRFALDQLAALGVDMLLHHYLFTGNYRHTYYLQHKAFFDQALARYGIDNGARQKTLLYAPTWSDAIGSSSFFAAFAGLISGLPAGYRLVVKMHPHLEYESTEVDRLLATAKGNPNIIIVRNCPLTFPLLDRADAYIGDMSALAYDFLLFNRPMFFLNQTAGTDSDASGSQLFRCGTPIGPGQYQDIYRIVDVDPQSDVRNFGLIREEVYRQTHAPERTFADLRRELLHVCSGPAPTWMRPPR